MFYKKKQNSKSCFQTQKSNTDAQGQFRPLLIKWGWQKNDINARQSRVSGWKVRIDVKIITGWGNDWVGSWQRYKRFQVKNLQVTRWRTV